MRVLYVNHTSRVSGAERSLLDLLSGLPPEVEPTVACPPGELAEAVRELGIRVDPLPGIDLSFRPHLRHTVAGLTQVARAGGRLRELAVSTRADILHANSARAGLAASLLRRRHALRLVVHVRDCLPGSLGGRATRQLLSARADLILANSDYTAANFVRGARPVPIETVYNGVDLERFRPGRLSRAEARRRVGLPADAPLLGVVAQIAPWKAQDDAIRALARLRRDGSDAELVVAGGVKFAGNATRWDNSAYERSLHELACDLQVGPWVHFLGDRSDVPSVMAALDLLLVPSWEEPFGKTIIEAMAMQLPVIATSVGGPAELVEHGENGLLARPRDPETWARLAALALGDRELAGRLGENGRRTARERFPKDVMVDSITATYARLLAPAVRNGREPDLSLEVSR